MYIPIILYYIIIKNVFIFYLVNQALVSPDITVVDKTKPNVMLRWSIGTRTAFPRELISVRSNISMNGTLILNIGM